MSLFFSYFTKRKPFKLLNIFWNLKRDWQLVPGPFCFSWCLLKDTEFENSNDIFFLRIFDNPIKLSHLQEFLQCTSCISGYFPKLNRDLGIVSGIDFQYIFQYQVSISDLLYLISQKIKQFLILNFCLDTR